MIPSDSERPFLEQLGYELLQRRRDWGLSRAAMAELVELSAEQVKNIENAKRRTRASTLRRFAEVLVEPAEVEAVLAHLLEVVGPALAPESKWGDRQQRRREKRRRRRELIEAEAVALVEERWRHRRY